MVILICSATGFAVEGKWCGKGFRPHEEGSKAILFLSYGNYFNITFSMYTDLMAGFSGCMFSILKKKTHFIK